MNVIKTNLNNFLVAGDIAGFLKEKYDDIVLTHNNVLQYAKDVFCHSCDCKMVMNGFNRYGKDKMGKLKAQRYRCPICKTNHEMSNEIIYGLISNFMKTVTNMILKMRSGYLSFECIAETLESIIKLSPDTVRRIFERTVDNAEINVESDFKILHYDEQHPKKDRTNKYRLSLFDGKTRQMIAEELYDDLSKDIVKEFLNKHLPKDTVMFIVTDLLPWYNDLLEELRPGCIIHQHCILHLNKLVVKDFHRNCSLKDELVKYKLLNIFYDRSEEIGYLQCAVKREQRYMSRHEKGYHNWLLEQRKEFHQFVRMLEKKRKRECKRMKIPDRMKMWSQEQARTNLDRLLDDVNDFSLAVQKRIRMIDNDWDRLTKFYRIDGAPATNNPIENYYSCSCKQIKKKQHRRNSALIRQWKLYAMKRAGMLKFNSMTIREITLLLIPFQSLT